MRNTQAGTLNPRLQLIGLALAAVVFSYMVVWLIAHMGMFGRVKAL